jgi:NADH-quinone oxidoreductase subunit L
MLVVAVIGAATALFAATIALFQNDIKRVLAYSTVSQLGYMFMASGVAAFGAGVFHLMTHAFFKALLFLGAGSVIHGMSDEQDMRKMGGLKKYMPVTFITMLIATLAISGLPGISGFFSKDEILWQAFSSDLGHPVFWFIGMLTALLTTFYMFRLVFLTFFGKERMDEKTKSHLHESPKVMTIPLIVLAVLSIAGGWIGIPKLFFGATNYFEHWLEPVFAPAQRILQSSEAHHNVATEWGLMATTVALSLGAFALALRFYLKKPETVTRLRESFAGVHRLLYGKYFIDEIYDRLIIRPLHFFSIFLWKIVDVLLIDGLINGGAFLIGGFSRVLRYAQTGRLTSYVTVFTVGVALIAGAMILMGYNFDSPLFGMK